MNMSKLYVTIAAAAALPLAMPISAQAIANPASTFCVAMGGNVVVVKLASGDELGLCYLTDKKIVEEWTLFRMFDGKIPPKAENPFLAD